MVENRAVTFEPIGVIRTPYRESAPRQADAAAEGDFRIIVDECYRQGLNQLERFRYLYVFFHIDRLDRAVSMMVSPPMAEGRQVGLFASRSPVRPNPIGLSIVRIKRIAGTVIHTTGIDALDGTPLLDIKPYIRHLDVKLDANDGWLDDTAL